MQTVICVLAAYCIGSISFAIVVSRLMRLPDPRSYGSKNPGATNVYRTAGRRAGVLTLVGDVFKGAAAAGLGWAIGGHGLGVACGVAAVVGHVAPLSRLSRGGKGVATGAGMALVLFPLAALVSAARARNHREIASVAGRAKLPPKEQPPLPM